MKTPIMPEVQYKDFGQAFRDAIASGRLSEDFQASNYAGDYRYVGTWDGKDVFQHRGTQKRSTMRNPIYKLGQVGILSVYQRGRWATVEHLPRYFVLRETDGHILEEFRRRRAATRWAEAHHQDSSSPSCFASPHIILSALMRFISKFLPATS